MLPSKQFESHSQSANGIKRPFGVKNDNYGPCHGADFTKMIPCPGVGILKMIPCSAARPRTEKYMSTSPGLYLRQTKVYAFGGLSSKKNETDIQNEDVNLSFKG